MPEKTQKELIQELYQAVIGIPESPDDNGLLGDVKEVKLLVQAQNSRVRKNEQKISRIWGVLLGVGIVGGTGAGIGIKTLLGG